MRVVVLLVVAALAAPAAASAEPQWVHDSPISEQSAGYLLCAGSDGSSVFDEILPAIDYAEAFIDQADLPPRGGIQSVRVQWWATGGDYCARWSPTGTTIELILPPGVELALGPANPALCGFSVTQDAAVCPVLTGPGSHGGTILYDGRSGKPALWPVTDGVNKTRLIVPVRLTRPVASFARSAELRCNAAPCPPDQAGDRAQFAVSFTPGAGAAPSAPLVTTVGLLGGRGAPRLLTRRVPQRVRRSTLRRGLPLRMNATAGATLRARLTFRGRTIAQTRRTARSSGPQTLRLRVGARGLRRLGSRARLIVSRSNPGEPALRQTVTLRIDR
jgi:hypothetical protein